MVVLHFILEALQIREGVRLPGEVFEVHHIVDIQAYAVQRNMALPVLIDHGAHFLLAGIAPAALDIAEGPAGREIAVAGELAEGTGDAGEGLLLDEVYVQVAAEGGDDCLVMLFPAQVPDDLSRIVQVEAEKPVRAEEDQQVVAAVEAGALFRVVEDVAVPAFIAVAAFINAAHGLAQAEEDFLRMEGQGQDHAAVLAVAHGKVRQGIFLCQEVLYHCVRGKGRAKGVLTDHYGFLTYCYLRDHCNTGRIVKQESKINRSILRNTAFFVYRIPTMINLNNYCQKMDAWRCTSDIVSKKTGKEIERRLRERAGDYIL